MNKHLFTAALTTALIIGSATPAFAAENMTTSSAAQTARIERKAEMQKNREQLKAERTAMNLTHRADVLKLNINRAVTNLTTSQTHLTARIAKRSAKGFDTSATQSSLTDLGTQISSLKNLVGQVPATPTDAAQVEALRAQFKTMRAAGWKDVSTTNKALASSTKTATK